MRIRKNYKISPHMFSGSETLICQLNQSPWDVITFPTSDPATPPPRPPYQVDGYDRFTRNGSSRDSIGAVHSAASMKISMEGEEGTEEINTEKRVYGDGVAVGNDIFKGENGGKRENPLGFKQQETVLCCKTDGKGWHCRREAKESSSLCEHHLTQLQNYNNLAHTTAKNLGNLVENRCRPRAKRASSSSNPNEYYYYSGFGPTWGKKRDHGRAKKAELGNSNDMNKPVEPIEPVTEPAEMTSLSQIDNEEFCFAENEDDCENSGEPEKKRARKPIKARSLKSLM